MIIPAILEKDWDQIEKKIELCRNFTRNIHIDFIDGKFATDVTFLDPEPFKKYSELFNFEAHLMVEEPVNYLEPLANAGFKTFLGHVERMHDQVEFVAHAERLGSVGLALDINTPLSDIRVSLEDLDQILLMSIIAGASGRIFDEKVLPKIKSLAEKSFHRIEIDGGINDKTLPVARENGANIFCVNSFLFNHNPHDNYMLLESLVRS